MYRLKKRETATAGGNGDQRETERRRIEVFMSRTPRRTRDPPSRGLNLRAHDGDARGPARRARPRDHLLRFIVSAAGGRGRRIRAAPSRELCCNCTMWAARVNADSGLGAVEVLTKRLSVDVDETVNQGTSCW